VLVNWFNADEVRKKFDDWDFSEEGRMRQAQRMRDLCNESDTEINMVDMVAPLPEMRTTLDADWLIWMHTIEEGRFEDTNKAFVAPDIKEVNMKFPKWGTERDAQDIGSMVLAYMYKLGYEIEWGDIDRTLEIPSQLGTWENAEIDIVNIHEPYK